MSNIIRFVDIDSVVDIPSIQREVPFIGMAITKDFMAQLLKRVNLHTVIKSAFGND